MLCYRYMKFKPAQWSLEDGWFKTARPSELNDPFDCRLNFSLFCIMGHGRRNGKRRTSQLSAA